MDLLDRLGEGSELVLADAKKLVEGKPVCAEYLAEAAQKAIDLILAKSSKINPERLTPAQVSGFLSYVTPANT